MALKHEYRLQPLLKKGYRVDRKSYFLGIIPYWNKKILVSSLTKKFVPLIYPNETEAKFYLSNYDDSELTHECCAFCSVEECTERNMNISMEVESNQNKSNKYRIVKVGNKFRVEKLRFKLLWLFPVWQTKILNCREHGMDISGNFECELSTKNEADKFIKNAVKYEVSLERKSKKRKNNHIK